MAGGERGGPVERLRRLAARAPELGADGAWLAERLGVYLTAAADTSLEHCLGLRPSWRTVERRQRRNRLICRLAALRCPGLSRYQQAQVLAAELRQYQAAAWVRDRRAGRPPDGCTDAHAVRFEIFRLAPSPVSWRALWEVLGGSDFAVSNPVNLQTKVGTVGGSGNSEAD
jgi:hypothetical protein